MGELWSVEDRGVAAGKICTIDGCDRSVEARMLCKKHYYAARRSDDRNNTARSRCLLGCARAATNGGHGLCRNCVERANRHGLTLLELVKLVSRKRCDVCSVAIPVPAMGCIDHDHETGVVRGLLCGVCNSRVPHTRSMPDGDLLKMALLTYLGAVDDPTC